ncbi:MAG: hemerythrin domain-containing protein, partial [Planctomycetota bacterium]
PWLAQRAEDLRSEHDDLATRMERLVRFAEDSSDVESVNLLRNEFHGFLADFRRHESDENELILQAFNDELGVGD